MIATDSQARREVAPRSSKALFLSVGDVLLNITRWSKYVADPQAHDPCGGRRAGHLVLATGVASPRLRGPHGGERSACARSTSPAPRPRDHDRSANARDDRR